MPQYYIKDNANAIEPLWDEFWVSMHKQDLKPERDRLNEEHPAPQGVRLKRFTIGEMK